MTAENHSFIGQGGYQALGTFCSLGMGMLMAVLAGLLFKCIYNENPYKFYLDEEYIEMEEHEGKVNEEVPLSERPLN